MLIIDALIARSGIVLAASLLALAAQAQPLSESAKPELRKASLAPEKAGTGFKSVVDKAQTCNKEGTSVSGGTKWCRSGEWHECNGKNGEWVNTRQKCKS